MQHNPTQVELVKMPEKLDDTQKAKLPRWARDYISELSRAAERSVDRYNSHQLSQEASRIATVDRYKSPLFVPDGYVNVVTFDLTPPEIYAKRRALPEYSPRDWLDFRVRQGPEGGDNPSAPMSVEVMASRRLLVSAHASNVLWLSTETSHL